MPKGKAYPIVLSKLQRRALENLRSSLERYSNSHTSFVAKYFGPDRKSRRYDEVYYMPIIKLNAILLAADGLKNKEISESVQISEQTVGKWRNEFAYILSRDDLPFERIRNYFWFMYNPVDAILDGKKPFQNDLWGDGC